MRRQPGQKRPSEFGLHARAQKPWRRWAVDFDYADRLGPAEREWLERFGREYYGADAKALKAPDALHCTKELRADVYGAQNAAYRDVYSRGDVVMTAESHYPPPSAMEDRTRGP